MLTRELVGLLLRLLHVAVTACALFLLEPALRLPQLAERGAGLPCATRMPDAAARRMASAACRRLARPARGRDVALARQALEMSCRFFRLFRELALTRAAALAALTGERLLPLALGFLLLPAGQLAQLSISASNLPIRLLLLGALGGFVLVRELVEILLEELGEIFLHRSGATAAAATAGSAAGRPASRIPPRPFAAVERAVLGLKRVRRSLCLELLLFGGSALCSAAFGRSFAMRRNAGPGSTSLLFMRLDEAFDLFAQLRLRQRDDDEALYAASRLSSPCGRGRCCAWPR